MCFIVHYRVSLLSVTEKVYTKVLQQRLKGYEEEERNEEQAGLRKGRGTMEQIFLIRQLSEKYTEIRVMRHCGVPEELVVLIEDLCSKSRSAVRKEGELV